MVPNFQLLNESGHRRAQSGSEFVTLSGTNADSSTQMGFSNRPSFDAKYLGYARIGNNYTSYVIKVDSIGSECRPFP